MLTNIGMLPAHAQQAGQLSLGVAPAITELVLEPGQPKSITITVDNLTNEPLPITATATSLTPFEQVADKDRAIFDASKWIRVTEPDFILQAHQKKQVAITVTPPLNAEPGGHYATLFFQPLEPERPRDDNAAYVGAKVGVLGLFIINGDLQERMSIHSLNAHTLNQDGPVEFELQLQNTGNVHSIPTGQIKIVDIFGNIVETVPIPLTIVLPKTTKNVPLTWDNKKRLGYYTAQLEIRYGEQKTSLVQTTSLLILPWLNTIGLVIVVGASGFTVWRARGRWGKAFRALSGTDKMRLRIGSGVDMPRRFWLNQRKMPKNKAGKHESNS